MDTFEGAVMIADITGFTKLTEELSKKGPSGVELLTKCMNNFFSKVRPLCIEVDVCTCCQLAKMPFSITC